MQLNRRELSLIITFCSLSIVILIMFNIHLGTEPQEEYVIEMSLADEDLEKLLEEEEQADQEQVQAEAVKSHMAFNETAKPSYGNPEPLKTLEQIMEEQAQAEDGELNDDLPGFNSAYDNSLRELARKREELKEKLGEKEAQKKEYTNYLAKRRTSVSYSLLDRNSYRLPPPIYTCIEGGTVVVNIQVDSNGYVTRAEFNNSSSNTSNGCLVDNAITYAYRARFNPADIEGQIGTITYVFQSK